VAASNLWPTTSPMIFASTPSSMSTVAVVCRAQWIVVTGNPGARGSSLMMSAANGRSRQVCSSSPQR
jgi:hypothetical protein